MTERLANDEDVLAEFLLDWEDSQNSAKPKSPEQICTKRPDLVIELKRRIAALANVDWMMLNLSSEVYGRETIVATVSTSPYPNIPGYQILGKIGQGGMGVVFQAKQERLNRLVAIKVIRGGRWVSAREIDRFKSEAELLAKVQHSGVVQIHDILECDGVLCLILEFVDGKSLAEKPHQSTKPPMEAASLARNVAATLTAVHAKGILHRDIKPGNILIDKDGCVKVTDFGVAKELSTDSSHTMPGEIIGSPSYMAPEQARGKLDQISERTDVYAIGATLYELLTGRPPFAGSSTTDTLEAVKTKEPIPLTALVSSIPKDLETICLKCLEKEPTRRYASAADLGDDLGRFLQGIPIAAKAVSPVERGVRWCRRNPDKAALTAFAFLAIVAFATGMTWFSTRLASAKKEALERGTSLKTQQLYAQWGRIRERSFSRSNGWLKKSLREITNAATLADTDAKQQLLRTEAIRCFCSCDMRVVKKLITGVDISKLVAHPNRPILALGANRAEDESVVIRLIDSKTFQELTPLSFAASPEFGKQKVDGCRSLLFTPSGNTLLVGSRRGWVYVFDTFTWKQIDSWQAHTDWVIGMAAEPNGQSIYTASASGDVKQWDLASHALLRESQSDQEIMGLCLTDHFLVVAEKYGGLLNLETFERRRISESEIPFCAAVAPDVGGTGVLTNDGDRLKHIELATGRVLRQLLDPRLRKAHQTYIHAISTSRSGRFAVSTDRMSVKMWDCVSGSLIASRNVGDEGGIAVEFLPDGIHFVVAGANDVELYEIVQDPALELHPLSADMLSDASLSQSGQIVVQISNDSSRTELKNGVQLLDLASGSHRERKLPDDAVVDEVLFSERNSVALLADRKSHCIRVFDGESLSQIREIPCESEPQSCTIAGDGNQFYFTADDLTAIVLAKAPSALFVGNFKDTSKRLLWSNTESQQRLNRSQILAIGAGNQRLATSSRDGMLRIHRAHDGAVVMTVPVESHVTCLKMPNDSLLLTGDDRGTIRLLKLPECTLLDQYFDHSEEITGLVIDDRHQLAVSSCRGGEVRLWRLHDSPPRLQLTATIGPLSGMVKRLNLAGDGETLMIVVDGESAARILRIGLIRENLKNLGLNW